VNDDLATGRAGPGWTGGWRPSEPWAEPAETATRAGPAADVLAVTGDPVLAERLAGIAAAAGVLIRTSRAAPAGAAWASARLVLVGRDALADLPPGRAPGGPGVVVVATAPVPQDVWRLALAVGAEQVTTLPDGEGWLVERILDATDPAAPAPVVGVVGGRGGGGASVLAAALAVTAAASGRRPVLLDADPLGGGLDLLLGAEREPGLRWPDLATARGRLRPGHLASGLPCVDGVRLLSWDRSEVADAPADAMAAVLSSAVRDSDLVVVDLPRALGSAAEAAASACRLGLVVVPAEVRAAAAARRVVAALEHRIDDLRLVVRGPAPTGLPAEVVADALRLPLAGELRAEPGLAAVLDRGEIAALRTRGPLAALCRRLLAETAAPEPARRAGG